MIYHLLKLEEDYCKNNYYLFDININSEIIARPLLSTICIIALSEDKDHPIAKFTILVTGNKIKCFVDVSQIKYKKDDHI